MTTGRRDRTVEEPVVNVAVTRRLDRGNAILSRFFPSRFHFLIDANAWPFAYKAGKSIYKTDYMLQPRPGSQY